MASTELSGGLQDGLSRGRTPPEGVIALQGLSFGEVVVRYRTGVGALDRRLFELGDAHADATFEADSGLGRWSVRTLLGHLADADLVYAHRLRRVVAEDGAVLSNWDEDSFIDGGLYERGRGPAQLVSAPPVGGFVAMIYTTRQWLGEWLMSLGDEARAHRVMHPWYGPSTMQDLLSYVTWHFEHHAGFLRRKLDHLVGPLQSGGCCSENGGCACEAEGKAKPADGGCCGGGQKEG